MRNPADAMFGLVSDRKSVFLLLQCDRPSIVMHGDHP